MEIIHRILRDYGAVFRLVFKFTFWRDINKLFANKSHASLDMFVSNLFKRGEISLTVAGDTNQLDASFERVIETDRVHNLVFDHNRNTAEFILEVIYKFANRVAFEIHHAIHDESIQHPNYAKIFIKRISNLIVFFFTGSLTIDCIGQVTPDAL